MPSDPYTVLRALLRAEAVRSAPKARPEQHPERGRDPKGGERHRPKAPETD
ncbi:MULTISPECIES: hypothetical protein [Streptomyces]|uniref:hypothetical protein n=1 Tax=Streptomyces TaxID=1883 RepID=UPI000B1F029E|nr:MULTISPECIES: hypothetical protein [Streptomyces]MCL6738624.1 hypothetical protein [Streptomyces neyagawaensis]MDE1681826.1 hypothetical protein [Streptomyces neyagawaensis]